MKKQQKKMECKISKAKPCSIPNQTLFCTVFCFIPTYYHVLVTSIRWIMEKAREFQKNINSALLTMPKPLTVWITINCGKFWKRWESQTT